MSMNNLVARYQSTHEPYGTVTQEITQVVPENVTPDFYYKGLRFISRENFANSQLAAMIGVSDFPEDFDIISSKAYKKGYYINPVYSIREIDTSNTKAVISKGEVVVTKIGSPVPSISYFKMPSAVCIGLAYVSREDVVKNFNVNKRVSSELKEKMFRHYIIYIDSVKKGNFYDFSIYFNKTLVCTVKSMFAPDIQYMLSVADGTVFPKLTEFLKELSVKNAKDVTELFNKTAKPVYLDLPYFLFYT